MHFLWKELWRHSLGVSPRGKCGFKGTVYRSVLQDTLVWNLFPNDCSFLRISDIKICFQCDRESSHERQIPAFVMPLECLPKFYLELCEKNPHTFFTFLDSTTTFVVRFSIFFRQSFIQTMSLKSTTPIFYIQYIGHFLFKSLWVSWLD